MDLTKSDKSQSEQDELRKLRDENARLKRLLTQHGIAWKESAIPESAPTSCLPQPSVICSLNLSGGSSKTES
jgi:hypothetical protein